MNRQSGFTLIELIITVAIAAILLTIGVPSFQDMMRNNRAAAQANEMLTGLNFARSEAVKRGQNVSFCPSIDQNSCTDEDNWAVGWIVSVAASGEVLRVWEALSGDPTLTGPTTALIYRPTGELVGGDTSFFYALDTRKQCTSINAVGRPHIEKLAKDATACP